MAKETLGRNQVFPIYDGNGGSFFGLVLKKAAVDSIVMSLSDKISGDVLYKNNSLQVTMHEYIVYNGVKYILVNPPTIVRNGIVSESSDTKGMTKYSFEFYHPMYQLSNLPFTDVAVTEDSKRYLSENKSFSWIGYPNDYIAKLNKNLENTQWICEKSSKFPTDKDSMLSSVLSFDNSTIADALKVFYDMWDVPFVIDQIGEDEDAYEDGKRFKVVLGLPSNEIYSYVDGQSTGIPYVFRMGQGVGLKNNSRTPRNNKIVTRIAGYGSENNIPYGYPQIVWKGDQSWDYTINNDSTNPLSYPLYMGIVNGEYVKLIKHPFTRTHLMPSVFTTLVNKKVNPYAEGYDPDTEIIDYYDADGEEYPNKINPLAPSYESHAFEEIMPELGAYEILGARPVNSELEIVAEWDDTMDDDGNYLQSYFQITLPKLQFDLYACASITQKMEINMRGGACIGCTFPVQVDLDVYKENFYADGNFAPEGEQRNYDLFPDSRNGSINVIVKKEYDTFGTLMPNRYQTPKSGDAFVILGISLPLSYIEDAEERLDDEMKSYMLLNNVYYFDYPLKFDEYFLANNTEILSQIRPNSIVRFMFADKELELYVRQLTIRFGDNVLPQYDITLTDNIDVVANAIGSVRDNVDKLAAIMALMKQGQGAAIRDGAADKLSRIVDDEAHGLIGFMKGAWFGSRQWFIDALGNANLNNATVNGVLRALKSYINKVRSTNYSGDGMLDTGWQIINDYEGSNSKAVFDYLYIRKKAIFEELEIRKLTQLGGNFVFSPASGRAWRVELRNNKDELLGYSEVTVPYTLGGTMLSLFKKLFGRQSGAENGRYLLGRRKLVARKLTEEELRDAYTCRVFLFNDDGTTQTMNNWTVDALARCQTFNIESQMAVVGSSWVGKKVSNTYWWRRVRGTGKETCDDGKEHYYVDFYLNRNDMSQDCDAGSDVPSVGDVFAQFGHWTQQSLANVIMIETYSGDAPAFKEYRGIGLGGWSLNGKQKTKISPTTGTVMYSTAFHIETEYGDVLVPVDRGRWPDITQERSWDMVTKQWVNDGRRCYYYDRVEHNGSTWLCTVGGTHFEDEAGNWYTEADMEGKRVEKRNYTIVEPGDTTDIHKMYWQLSVSKGDKGEASFKSQVFKRSATKPDLPAATEGSFGSPVPSGWHDGLPEGTETIWMTTRIFSTDGKYPQEDKWTPVQLMSDTESFDVEFAKKTADGNTPPAPNGKNQHGGNPQIWYDPTLDSSEDFTTMIWMATRTKDNGVWGAWKITKIKGEDGGFKSRVFKRTNADISKDKPTGGTYAEPIPTSGGWEDGIPAGEEILWSSVCTFWSDGTNSGWSYPAKETDTSDLDVEFSASTTKPNPPTGDTPHTDHSGEGWFDPNLHPSTDWASMIWRAERKIKNGAYESSWVVSKIKGEKGQSSFTSHVFLRQNSQPEPPSGGSYHSPVPSGWSDGVPDGTAMVWMSTRIFSSDGNAPQQSEWTAPRQMTDTADFDVEFSSVESPAPPSGHPNTNTQWSNTSDSSTIWMATSECHNGVWSDWNVAKIKGEKGEDAVTTVIYYTGPTDESVTAADIKRDYASDTVTWTQTAPSPTVAAPMVWVGVWNNVVAGTNLNPKKTQPSSVSLFCRYGDDGKSIFASPNAILIKQERTNEGSWPLSNIDYRFVIVARDGSKIVNATISKKSGSDTYGTNCTADVVNGTNGTTQATMKISAVASLGEENLISLIDNQPILDEQGNPIKITKYATSGSVDFHVKAGSEGHYFEADISVPFSVDLLGKYFMTITEDVKTEVHTNVDAAISDEGVLTETNFDHHIVTSAEGTFDVIKKVVKEIGGGTFDKANDTVIFNNSRISTAEGNITNINRSVYGITGYNEQGEPIIDIEKRDFFTKKETPDQVNTIVGKEGYQKAADVEGIVEGYGYQNAEDVNNLINSNSKWSQYAEISQMNNAIGLSVMKMSQTIADTLVGSASSWEQGSTKDEEVGKTYEQIKNESISTNRIRTKDTMPFYNNMKLKFTAGFEIGIHPFDADGKLLYPVWISYSSSPITLTEGGNVPTGTRQVAFVMKKTSENDITPDEVVGNFVTAKQLRDTGIDITEGTILLKGDKVSFKDSSGNDANISFDTSHSEYTIGGFYISQNNGTGYLRDTYSYNKQDSMVHLSSKGQLYLNSNGNSGDAALVVNGATTIGGGNNPVSIGTSDTLSLNGNKINANGTITLSGTLKVSADIDSDLNIVSDTPSEIVIGVKGHTGYPDYKRVRIGWNKAYGFIKFDGIWPTEAQAKDGWIDDNVVFVDNNGYLRVRGVGGAGH